jgi:hypothetical protein
LVFHGDGLVGIIKLDGEFDGEDRFRRRGCTTIGPNGVCGQAWLCPFWNYSDLPKDDLGHVGVAKGDAITVL